MRNVFNISTTTVKGEKGDIGPIGPTNPLAPIGASITFDGDYVLTGGRGIVNTGIGTYTFLTNSNDFINFNDMGIRYIGDSPRYLFVTICGSVKMVSVNEQDAYIAIVKNGTQQANATEQFRVRTGQYTGFSITRQLEYQPLDYINALIWNIPATNNIDFSSLSINIWG
jgi:hypothetical protein